MNHILAMITATAVCMVVIPVMWRLAPRLGMIDQPDPRKVHSTAVARIGGWGIVLGSLLAVLLWMPIDRLLLAYILGSLVLLGFGAWDDSREMGHYPKFIGQFIAVGLVIFYGELYITTVPIFGALPAEIGIPFTLLAMVGMINAINHSDGLDGLAGGESLMSLIAIAFLAFAGDGLEAMIIAAAVIGGILGFLRYNTHPARIFMGDGGSQFLGFTLGFLVVLLTQRIDPALSQALPALLLGLPIIDIIAVLILRATGGMNFFRATRNHIHHRLLDLGFDHYETVLIIYAIQALLVTSAIVFRYDWDYVILGFYLLVTVLIFGSLTLAERLGWRTGQAAPLAGWLSRVRHNPAINRGSLSWVGISISLFLVGGSLFISTVPQDFSLMSIPILIVMLAVLLFAKQDHVIAYRIAPYAVALFVVYLTIKYPPVILEPNYGIIEITFFALLALAIVMTFRHCKETQFNLTPTDYLILVGAIGVSFLSEHVIRDAAAAALFLKGVIVLYGCELLINHMRTRWNPLTLSSMGALGILGWRGLS